MPEKASKTEEKSDIEKTLDAKERLKEKCMKMTGQVLCFVYRPHMGFADFAIVTLRLKDGKIVEVPDISDPYLAIEAGARMEDKQSRILEKMRQTYPEGHRHV